MTFPGIPGQSICFKTRNLSARAQYPKMLENYIGITVEAMGWWNLQITCKCSAAECFKSSKEPITHCDIIIICLRNNKTSTRLVRWLRFLYVLFAGNSITTLRIKSFVCRNLFCGIELICCQWQTYNAYAIFMLPGLVMLAPCLGYINT